MAQSSGNPLCHRAIAIAAVCNVGGRVLRLSWGEGVCIHRAVGVVGVVRPRPGRILRRTRQWHLLALILAFVISIRQVVKLLLSCTSISPQLLRLHPPRRVLHSSIIPAGKLLLVLTPELYEPRRKTAELLGRRVVAVGE